MHWVNVSVLYLRSEPSRNILETLVQIGSEMKLVTFTMGGADRAGIADPHHGSTRELDYEGELGVVDRPTLEHIR